MATGNRDLMDILLHGNPEDPTVQSSLDETNLMQNPAYGQQGVGFTSSVALSTHGGTMQPLPSPVGQSPRYHPMSPTQVMPTATPMMQQTDMMGGQQFTPSSYADTSYQGYSPYPTQRRMSSQSSPSMDTYTGYNQNGNYMGSGQGMGQYGAQNRAMGHSMQNQYSATGSYSTQNYYQEGYPAMSPKSTATHQMQSSYPGNMQLGMQSGQVMHPMGHTSGPSPGSSYPNTGSYPSRPQMSPVQKQMPAAAQAFFGSRSPVSQQIHSPPAMGSNYPRQTSTSPVAQQLMGMPSRSSTSPVSAMLPQGMYSMPQQYSTANQSQQQSSCMYATQRLEKMSNQHQYKTQMTAASVIQQTGSTLPSGPSPGRRPSYSSQQNHTSAKHQMPSPSALSGQTSPIQKSPPQVGKSPPPFQVRKPSPPFHSKKPSPVSPAFHSFPPPGPNPVDGHKPDLFDYQRPAVSEGTGLPDTSTVMPAEKTNMQKLEEIAEKISPSFAKDLKEVSEVKGKSKEMVEPQPENKSDSKEDVEKGQEERTERCEEVSEESTGKILSPEKKATPEETREAPKADEDVINAEDKKDGESRMEGSIISSGESVEQSEGNKQRTTDENNPTEGREESIDIPTEMEDDRREEKQERSQEEKEENISESKEGDSMEKEEDKCDEEDSKMEVDEPDKEDEKEESEEKDDAVKEVTKDEEEEDETERIKPAPKMEHKSVTAKPWRSGASPKSSPPTIQATVIAKGQTANTNQQVLVAKTAGGQMYLIQGNVLIPVQNITVQQPKGEHGGRVICVNQGHGKSSQVVVGNFSPNLLQSVNVKKDSGGEPELDLSCKEKSITSPLGDSEREGDEAMASVSIQTERPVSKGPRKSPLASPTKRHGKLERKIDALKAKLEHDSQVTLQIDAEETSAERSGFFPDGKKRIGRPPGSKDKQKRKPYSHKRKQLEIDEEEFSPERKKTKHEKKSRELSRQSREAPKGSLDPGASTSHKRPLTIDIPTVSKSKSSTPKKRKLLPPPLAPSRLLCVQPRGGIDKGKWCCALCGKHSNFDSLGALYGPHKAKLSRERRDSASRECRSPDKLLSPSGRRLSGLPVELEGTEIELWVHKDCAVWSQGVYMLGRSLYGLEQAVETAATHKCSKCSEVGATLACFRRGCNKIFHYACARDSGCAFVEDNFTILCSSHKVSFVL